MPLSLDYLISSTLSFQTKRATTFGSIDIAGMKIGIFKSPTYTAADTKSMVRRVVMFNYVVRAQSNTKPYGYWVSGAGQKGGAPTGGYRVFIMIPQVNMRIMKSSDYYVKIANHRYMKPVSTGIPVKVRCDCHDFRWRFAYYDHQSGALYGATPPPYTPVPGSTRGPVNPKHLPGLCKHLMAAVKDLRNKKYLG